MILQLQKSLTMKSQLITFVFSVLLLSSVLSFNSCKKENSDNDTSVALDNFIADNESYRLEDFANSAAKDSGVKRIEEGYYTVLPSGAKVLLSLGGTKKSITIIFDENANGGRGNRCDDGKFRKGTIQVEWQGLYFGPGTIITITTSNYYVDLNKYDYVKTTTNMGKNAAGHTVWDVNVSKALITFADGKTINWTSQRSIELIQEGASIYFNVYSVTGTAEGTDRKGRHFTVTITSPLIVAVACPWVKQGTLEIKPDGKSACTIDYGTGGCDNKATAEINGVVYNITL